MNINFELIDFAVCTIYILFFQNGSILQTNFAEAFKEWGYFCYEIDKIKDNVPLTCPACSDGIHGLHCDGNRKLYRYNYLSRC